MDNTSLVLYLVFEFVEKDLAKYIREARTEDLSPGKIKVCSSFVFQRNGNGSIE